MQQILLQEAEKLKVEADKLKVEAENKKVPPCLVPLIPRFHSSRTLRWRSM